MDEEARVDSSVRLGSPRNDKRVTLAPPFQRFSAPRRRHFPALMPASASRYSHLDALRGVAAFCVLIYHVAFSSALSPVWLKTVPVWVNTLGHTLQHGVEVFFVLSGWVIAHSMRRDTLSLASLGRFLERRALRLTPPYWAAIVLALGFGFVARRLGSGDAAPSVQTIALNALYLQNIFKAGNVFTPAWTLCIEAQFYVVFALMLGVCGVVSRGEAGDEPFGRARVPLALLLFAGALLSLFCALKATNAALFVGWWFAFASGALGYLSTRDARFRPLFATVLVSMAGVSWWLFHHPARYSDDWQGVLVALLGLVFLLLAQGRERWANWGRAGVFEWLGRVSYSLYLTHFGFGLLLARAFRKIAGDNAGVALGLIALDMALCLVLAGLFYSWIERPSMEWAKKFKLSRDVA